MWNRLSGPIVSVSSRLLGDASLDEAATIAHRLGFQGVELWVDGLRRGLSLRALRTRLDTIPIHRYLHIPFYDLNPCSINPRIRRVSQDEMKGAVRIAAALDIRQVVVHPGHASTSKGDGAEAWPALVDTLGAFSTYAGRHGVRVAIEAMENRPKELLVRLEDVKRLYSEAPDLAAGVCLDLAHAWTVDKDCADRFVGELRDRIIHVHISNVRGRKIHLPLDCGDTPVTPNTIRFLRDFEGPLTLEGAGPAWPHAAEVGVTAIRHLLSEGGDVLFDAGTGKKELTHSQETGRSVK